MTDPDLALTWRRSTRCDTNACAEVATYPNVVYLRNSAELGKVLAFTRDEWDTFVAAVKDGDFGMTGAPT